MRPIFVEAAYILCVAGRAPHPEGTRGCPYSPYTMAAAHGQRAEALSYVLSTIASSRPMAGEQGSCTRVANEAAPPVFLRGSMSCHLDE